jgi:hypothetical protein
MYAQSPRLRWPLRLEALSFPPRPGAFFRRRAEWRDALKRETRSIPGGHVPSTAIAAASASATVLASRAGDSTFNAHDVAAATSDAFDDDERGG